MHTYYNQYIGDIVVEKEINDLDREITLEEVAALILDSCEYTACLIGDEFAPSSFGNDCRCYDFEVETDSIDGGETYAVCLTDSDITILNQYECESIRLNICLAE